MPDPISVFDLTPAEKLQLVEDLWDDLASTPEAVPVHDWQIQELARRRTAWLMNPGAVVHWDDAKRQIRTRHGR